MNASYFGSQTERWKDVQKLETTYDLLAGSQRVNSPGETGGLGPRRGSGKSDVETRISSSWCASCKAGIENLTSSGVFCFAANRSAEVVQFWEGLK